MSGKSASKLRDQIAARFNAWYEKRCLDNEFAALGFDQADQELNKAGLARDRLPEIIRRYPEASDLLRRVMAAIGINHDLLRRGQPEALHHLELICASCRSRNRCKGDLARGTTDETFQQFCPNAQDLMTMKRIMTWVKEPSAE